jgi:hypothetical protein
MHGSKLTHPHKVQEPVGVAPLMQDSPVVWEEQRVWGAQWASEAVGIVG